MKKIESKLTTVLAEEVNLTDYFGVGKAGVRYMLQSKSLLHTGVPAEDGWSILLTKRFTQKDTTHFEDQLHIGKERTLEEIIIHLINNGAEVFVFDNFVDLAKWATYSN